MNKISYFDRLVESVGLIARHPAFPGKGQAVERCAGEIDDLVRSGGITDEQGGILLEILAGVRPRAPHNRLSAYPGDRADASGLPLDQRFRAWGRLDPAQTEPDHRVP
jgi:hypothetical protein